MHQKLQHLQPALVNRKGPICLHDNTQLYVARPLFQKLNELGYQALPHLPYAPNLSPTDCHFFKHLNNILQGKCFHNQQEAENAFLKSSSNPEVWIFTLQEQTHLFLTGKSVLTVMVPILINKDVFEPSYNDLKFVIWNHNYIYICTNLYK